MELRKIDLQNVWKIVHLSVSDEQKDFVATNAESLIEAYAAIQSGEVALPFALYDREIPVGFVMIGYDSLGEENEPSVAKGNYCLWRFMIDAAYQGRGLGKAAMEAVLAYIRTFPCGQADACWLSYEPENIVAKALYHKFGVRENGEKDGEEIVAVLGL